MFDKIDNFIYDPNTFKGTFESIEELRENCLKSWNNGNVIFPKHKDEITGKVMDSELRRYYFDDVQNKMIYAYDIFDIEFRD